MRTLTVHWRLCHPLCDIRALKASIALTIIVIEQPEIQNMRLTLIYVDLRPVGKRENVDIRRQESNKDWDLLPQRRRKRRLLPKCYLQCTTHRRFLPRPYSLKYHFPNAILPPLPPPPASRFPVDNLPKSRMLTVPELKRLIVCICTPLYYISSAKIDEKLPST
jgi:hypothetical protein